MERIVILGAGGLAKTVADIVERTANQQVIGWIAPGHGSGEMFFGYPILGDDDALAGLLERYSIDAAMVAIGDNWRRSLAVRRALDSAPGLRFVSAIHPAAQIGRGAVIGTGAVIEPQAVIECDASIGEFALISNGAAVGHDATVGEFATVASHGAVGGEARLGAFSALCLGAKLFQRRSIGNHSVVGAGSIVTRDIASRVVAYGSPARIVRPRQPGEPYLSIDPAL